MRRPRLVLQAAFALCFSTLITLPPAFAATGEPERENPGLFLLKLRAVHTVYDYPEGARDYKRPPKVDSKLVGQIMQVRTAVPCWRGIPHLTPGGFGAAH